MGAWFSGSGVGADVAEILEEVVEIENHLHSRGHWYGKDPGDTFLLENGLVSWRLTAGTGGVYGNWVQLSNGDEITAGAYYDPHEILVTAASANGAVYYIQFAHGESGAQVISGMTSFLPQASLKQGSTEVQSVRVAATAKYWARCCCSTNGATIDFLLGLHVYPE